MNGTVIDIPGITVSVTPHESQYSTDMAYTIEIRDKRGNKATVYICYGKITDVNSDIIK